MIVNASRLIAYSALYNALISSRKTLLICIPETTRDIAFEMWSARINSSDGLRFFRDFSPHIALFFRQQTHTQYLHVQSIYKVCFFVHFWHKNPVSRMLRDRHSIFFVVTDARPRNDNLLSIHRCLYTIIVHDFFDDHSMAPKRQGTSEVITTSNIALPDLTVTRWLTNAYTLHGIVLN